MVLLFDVVRAPSPGRATLVVLLAADDGLIEGEELEAALGRSASFMMVGSDDGFGGLDIACSGSYFPGGMIVLLVDDAVVAAA